MKKNPRMAVLVLGFFAAVILVTTSCGRDPIFHIISTETPPVPPLIRGGPTQMVVFDWGSDEESRVPVLFVASGGLFWYSATEHDRDDEGNVIAGTNAGWQKNIGIPNRPSGRIIDIATTQNHLYILSMEGTGVDTTIHRLESGGSSWVPIGFPPGSGNIQSVFADPEGERLFAGVQSGGISFIYYLADGSVNLSPLPTGTRILPNEQPTDNTGLLSGVVYRAGSYFLTTRNGVFEVGRGWLTGDDMARTFMGMIKLPDGTIIAITRAGGFLYQVNVDGLERIPIGDDFMRAGRDVTGALSLWDEVDSQGNVIPDRRMLIAGIQGSRHSTTFINGYVEFSLNEDGSLDTSIPRREAGSPGGLWSVQDTARYRTSLGRLPINHLFQAPREIDVNMTFFASTQSAGLWSYRDLEAGGWQWNAEN